MEHLETDRKIGRGGQRLGGGKGPRRRNPLVGAETVRQFNQRLHRNGQWTAYQADLKELMQREGISVAQGRDQLAAKYGAVHGVLPISASQGFKDEDGSYLETMNWVATALGWMLEGRPVSRLDAPGPKAWAMFQWAGQDEKSQDKFWAMWSQCNKRAVDDTAGSSAAMQAASSELLAMLDEIDAEVA